jgi:putative cardiolipin synthase
MRAGGKIYNQALTGLFTLVTAAVVASCAGRPTGADFPKKASISIAHPEDTALGRQFAAEAQKHGDASGFRIISVGVDGFRARMEMIGAAQQTLDLQYYIFRGDETGRLLTEQLRHAADRGVRIRVLVDDGDTQQGDQQLYQLAAYPSVEIRIFNPYPYRGHTHLLRNLTFLLYARRLDYRMHNKLMVVDGSAALVGGRNIGNEYFQVDPQSQFADEDVFVAGPMVGQLSHAFDQFWNSDLAIPAAAFGSEGRSGAGTEARSEQERDSYGAKAPAAAAIDYASLLAAGGPYTGITAGRIPLVWAHAQLVYDSPDKKKVLNGYAPGRLIATPVLESARAVQSELLMVTPFFIPTSDELQLLQTLRDQQAHVRILTNSLESNPEIVAQSGYEHYRVPLLQNGAQLYEVRPLLGNVRGSGQTRRISRYGHYALHGKLYVFDRQKVFIGSMNFDQRSQRINTEIGLIIGSSELAQQTVTRFEEMVKPENCYRVELSPASGAADAPHLVWRTQQAGQEVVYTREPARSGWQRFKARLLSWLPIEGEL